MEINRQTMEKEAKIFLKTLFSLPEIAKIAIKDIVIQSSQDEVNIQKGLDICYHDKFSDVDFNVWLQLHPVDYDKQTPFYKLFFPRLKLEDRIFGIVFQGRNEQENNKEGMRIVLKNGFRMDVTCHVHSNPEVQAISEMQVDWEERTIQENEFWFITIQTLAKLFRHDYLIADHLTHMLIMEGLVLQMVARDEQYQTNFHRYGYSESLKYCDLPIKIPVHYKVEGDNTYNYIVEQLCRAVNSYEELLLQKEKTQENKAQLFYDIWDCYCG